MFQSFDVTARPDAAPPRVARLRAWMAEERLDAFLVPRTDAWQGEYVAPRDERLAWITGFTGSAGFAAILADRAAIFTDGRYTVQVAAQTDPDTFETVDWPATGLADWLPDALPEGGRVGFDPMLHPVREIAKLRELDGVEMVPVANGVDRIWEDRPAAPAAPMRPYPDALAGRTAAEKRAQIGTAIEAASAQQFVTNQPDAIAWLLNIRGGDIARMPVAQAFAVIHADGSVDLICDPAKTGPVADHLGSEVRVVPLDDLIPLLESLAGPTGFDPAACTVAMHATLREPLEMDDPVALPKARKTDAEIAATREAHLRDGAAMVRFLHWLDTERAPGTTEIDVVRALERFRRDTDALRDISFDTIAGSGPNGAIVHYRVNEETNRVLDTDNVLLVDSGGQYEDGTTDVTRTIPLGRPPKAVAHAFTRVLQGMIAVSRVRVPKGVTGANLDALARAPLWAEHRDYDHGTGHGVGVYLGVHEGPARISRASHVPLEPGMILSNEPGYYRAGEYGIRIENLVTVVAAERPDGGDARAMRAFETLTFVPIDRRLVLSPLLSSDERAWIDGYHAEVLCRIGPRLDAGPRAWLAAMCAPL
ncbi:aminopeptidase P family protein [uncultured Jannaschia sp.]|uniref:aminopeptidase P family protein n=1 Tax=uncultured Jannaschia sp. TaxID=293347 RepID=UPI0026045F75|nr:aminopeptidase P family protein [uncultured Jannaschia sp.]